MQNLNAANPDVLIVGADFLYRIDRVSVEVQSIALRPLERPAVEFEDLAAVAMRDGTLLGRELRKVASGAVPLSEALATYERGMLDYGFAVVREAAETGRQRMAQNPLPAPLPA